MAGPTPAERAADRQRLDRTRCASAQSSRAGPFASRARTGWVRGEGRTAMTFEGVAAAAPRVPSLLRWGFSADADLVYRTLIAFGPRTGPRLARELGIAPARVDRALEELLAAAATALVAVPGRARDGVRRWTAAPADQVLSPGALPADPPAGQPRRQVAAAARRRGRHRAVRDHRRGRAPVAFPHRGPPADRRAGPARTARAPGDQHRGSDQLGGRRGRHAARPCAARPRPPGAHARTDGRRRRPVLRVRARSGSPRR